MKITSPDQVKNLLRSPFITRAAHASFFSHVSHSDEVTILYGPRQVGKSQEIYKSIEALLTQKEKDVFLYTLDVVPDEFHSPDEFVATVASQKTGHPTTKTYVFLDEAQRLENIGLFVKYIYDQHKNIKFILTGSASLEIKSTMKEPLTGRKQEFFLSPLTLREIVRFRNIHHEHIQSGFPLLRKILEEFLLFGGYPEVVLLESKIQKIAKITEIANSYTLRDISNFFSFENPKTIQLVARFLAENIGGMLSKENVSKLGGITKYQTEKAIEALEKSFIIVLLPPLAKSPSKELIHRPKVYFLDLGIRNALLNKLDPTLLSADKGQLFENAIATELLSAFGPDNLKFWRTKNQTEVDFVAIHHTGKATAYEAKYQWEQQNRVPKNLQSIQKQYKDLISDTNVLSKENYWRVFTSTS